MNLTQKEEELIEHIREKGFGEIIVIIHNKEPQAILEINKSSKLILGLTLSQE